MVIIATVPLIILVIGLLLWYFAPGPKAQETGRLMFFAGLLVLLFSAAGHVWKIGGK